MQQPSDDIRPEQPLSPGTTSKYDQMHKTWGSYVDAIGYFYNELRRWGIREEYSIQMAARFQGHLEMMLESEGVRDVLNEVLDEREAAKAATKLSE